MDLIMTKDGKPFETEQAANLRSGVLKKSNVNTEVVKVDGGFALKKQEPKKVRVPMHESRRLRFPKREGFHRHVFNDDKKTNRIQRALDAGYTFVTEDVDGRDPRAGDASRIGKNTSQHVGDGMMGFLMEIPQELYEEDQGAKQTKIDMREAQVRREKKPSDGGDFYGGVRAESG